MNLLDQRDRHRLFSRSEECRRAREHLHAALSELIPGSKVWIFGSLLTPERFHRRSDLDIALEVEPKSISIYALTAELEERMKRPVDVLLLEACRFRSTIESGGERWTL